ncbi:Ser/Thr protein phosphatase, putative [Trichomonas vaginalis G3]|uniref:Serine/threonine-protein phosphatase n=1 Tax=Trichomonas vaginalis (strain ATCC PRA-98 / G3) TaxID=412133 RepID=A2EI86_TRIV3|nr:phosphoprotein phosphatase protein [Trichomonas vaginalis G3]XP_051081603.1 phosphoprotein phosphatase protein [Trichomonas vaginalis G3]EAY07646.1 Ser/Thr protein phosphatase, putative [Trichomonas vaginalis G3]KAI5494716.1 phosphoprotein phosphatase protein [Trichomonas vaginalis G3]KAI5500507.1 phosphoprotein phosphatase protein [Trichomonas vaginalis G3]|eukprot:XP_001319869.1 Ser/Thr protein phosphatase [Trichomonas vaginalis G3]
MTSLRVLKSFMQLIENYTEDNTEVIGYKVPVPLISPEMAEALIKETMTVLQNKPTLVRIDAPCYVVGDIHGNLYDLIRILSMAKMPPMSRYVFLGDYVDRGQFSYEIVLLLFALQCQYPNDVVLLRGNHEFADVNSVYGFFDEMSQLENGQYLYDLMNKAFEWLPIAAIIQNKIFCVHGGISPDLNDISQVEKIERPIKICEDELLADLMWSDPTSDTKTYARSTRGLGISYGTSLVHDYLKKNSLTSVLRGHQCVQNGIQKALDGQVYTVFSCSNYADALDNRCGLLFLNQTLEMQFFSLPPRPQLVRERTSFYPVNKSTIFESENTVIPFSITAKQFEIKKAMLAVPLPKLRSNSQCAMPKTNRFARNRMKYI